MKSRIKTECFSVLDIEFTKTMIPEQKSSRMYFKFNLGCLLSF